jgi:hypothetical protein
VHAGIETYRTVWARAAPLAEWTPQNPLKRACRAAMAGRRANSRPGKCAIGGRRFWWMRDPIIIVCDMIHAEFRARNPRRGAARPRRRRARAGDARIVAAGCDRFCSGECRTLNTAHVPHICDSYRQAMGREFYSDRAVSRAVGRDGLEHAGETALTEPVGRPAPTVPLQLTPTHGTGRSFRWYLSKRLNLACRGGKRRGSSRAKTLRHPFRLGIGGHSR